MLECLNGAQPMWLLMWLVVCPAAYLLVKWLCQGEVKFSSCDDSLKRIIATMNENIKLQNELLKVMSEVLRTAKQPINAAGSSMPGPPPPPPPPPPSPQPSCSQITPLCAPKHTNIDPPPVRPAVTKEELQLAIGKLRKPSKLTVNGNRIKSPRKSLFGGPTSKKEGVRNPYLKNVRNKGK